ncbi:hypothetical protein ACFLVM_01355 [Chloroflexota bacterium]
MLICGGNTCRSPMTKVILADKLKKASKLEAFMINSTAYDYPTYQGASTNAREAINQLFGEDLLVSHMAKKLTPDLVEGADLILVMGADMKRGLPREKTWTLKEYSGGTGDVVDPFGGNIDTYITCAKEISSLLEKVLTKLG